MSRVFVLAVRLLLGGSVLHPNQLLAVAVLCAATGCSLSPSQSSVVAPKSTVIAPAVSESTLSNSWLKSATLSYSYSRSQRIVPANATVAAPAVEANRSGMLHVLGVRYPHPDGHKDRARVELVVAEPTEERAAASWHVRLGQTLSETLPGIAWGAGIRRAKAIDLPLAELQQLVVDAQGTVTPADFKTPSDMHVQFASEINGQRNVVQAPPIAALEKLAARVEREGRLIAYPGSANELQQLLQQASPTQLAGNPDASSAIGSTARLALIPLPPVITR